MIETLVLILAVTAVVLGAMVHTLFQKNTQLRSDVESRLLTIERVEGPFARKLADGGPAPLKRAFTLKIQVYAKFWKDVFKLTAVQLEEIKTQVHNLKKDASAEAFDEHPFNITVRIEEWRGGYTHFLVQCPLYPLEKPKFNSRYDGQHNENLWQFEIPPHEGKWLSGWLWLETDGRFVRLYATGGRFGHASFVESGPAPENVFLSIPLSEGPAAEPYFKPDLKVEFAPQSYRYLLPWERCYQSPDAERGLAWELWINDCDLRTRTEGNETEGVARMLAGWHERFAWNEAGKAWYGRVARAIEGRYARERAELDHRPGTLDDAEPESQPGITEHH